jgi:hypothetical protein
MRSEYFENLARFAGDGYDTFGPGQRSFLAA